MESNLIDIKFPKKTNIYPFGTLSIKEVNSSAEDLFESSVNILVFSPETINLFPEYFKQVRENDETLDRTLVVITKSDKIDNLATLYAAIKEYSNSIVFIQNRSQEERNEASYVVDLQQVLM